MADPLPDLGAGDLGGRRVFHEVVERHAAGAPEPRLEVLHADADVVAEPRLGPRPGRDGEQVRGGDVHVLAEVVELVRALHVRVEDLARDGDQARVRHPGAVVPVLHLAELVGAHLGERRLVGGGIALDGDLRGHPAHRVDPAAMAGLDEELRVGAHVGLLHRHLAAVGEHRGGVAPAAS